MTKTHFGRTDGVLTHLKKILNKKVIIVKCYPLKTKMKIHKMIVYIVLKSLSFTKVNLFFFL